MLYNILHYFAQITVDLERIITVDARNEVWAFSKVSKLLKIKKREIRCKVCYIADLPKEKPAQAGVCAKRSSKTTG